MCCCILSPPETFLMLHVVGCQAEGPDAADEEESEKSMSEVNDEDDGDEEGSGEVWLYAGSINICSFWGLKRYSLILSLCTLTQEDDDE